MTPISRPLDEITKKMNSLSLHEPSLSVAPPVEPKKPFEKVEQKQDNSSSQKERRKIGVQVIQTPGNTIQPRATSLDVSKDFIAILKENAVCFYDAGGYREELREKEWTKAPSSPISVKLLGDIFAYGMENGTFEVVDIEKNVQTHYKIQIIESGTRVRDDVSILSACSTVPTVLYVGIAGGMTIHDIRVFQSVVGKTQFHTKIHTIVPYADEVTIATGGADKRACLWDVRKLEKPIAEFLHKSEVLSVAEIPWDPSVLLTGTCLEHGSIHVWNKKDGTQTHVEVAGNSVSHIFANAAYKEVVALHEDNYQETEVLPSKEVSRFRGGKFIFAYESGKLKNRQPVDKKSIKKRFAAAASPLGHLVVATPNTLFVHDVWT
jgi:hypothetical protein